MKNLKLARAEARKNQPLKSERVINPKTVYKRSNNVILRGLDLSMLKELAETMGEDYIDFNVLEGLDEEVE